MKLAGDDFQGTERFAVRRRLGTGGVGAVYEAYDRERAETVALKTLRWQDPTAIYRLKKEFRSLSDVAHPNLVSLYELVAEADTWFYTMELVDGVDFLAHVRPDLQGQPEAARARSHPGPAPDIPRLRAALSQLVAGVLALHRAGILHRDLKPSNVLVTRAGRVVILDFGVAAVVAPASRRQTEEGLWGTAAYMAPEEGDGQRSPAGDWYAVGVMLYESLTGRLPFLGSALKIMAEKTQQDPPSPSELVPGLPADLVDLCRGLLLRDPAHRPGDAELRQRSRAGHPTAGAGLARGPWLAPLVGRARELAELRDAFALVKSGPAVALYVHGPSGIGKSALVRQFVDALEQEGAALVLSGRCYERESVPYKALDGVIDSLSRHLMALPRAQVDAVLPREVAALTRLFSVLLRVEAFGDARVGEREPGDPLELRRRGFASLRELFTRLSARAPVVVFIDDLQWADQDSIALLEDL
ncbi:MAG TPA: AAA family ATPase, partial [Gemmatimonadales bacterium]|nr:AAA family ATPase [Gemmatimonadales bacterium]